MRMGFLNARLEEVLVLGDAGLRRDIEPALEQRGPFACAEFHVGDPNGTRSLAEEYFEKTPQEVLLESIADFRESIANALYEQSRDYQILCSLTHSDFKACDALVGELRKRLVHNLHYQVLGKLDEAYKLASPQLAGSR